MPLHASAQLQGIVTKLNAQRFNEQTFGARFNVSSDQGLNTMRLRYRHRLGGILRLHKQRETCAHVERAVGLAVVLVGVLLDELQDRRDMRNGVNAIGVGGRMPQQFAPAVAGDVGAVARCDPCLVERLGDW